MKLPQSTLKFMGYFMAMYLKELSDLHIIFKVSFSVKKVGVHNLPPCLSVTYFLKDT